MCKFTQSTALDRRDLSRIFRERFKLLLEDQKHNLPEFLKITGIDRSALSQLRDPKHDRLPRAETLRRIAAATGVSVDWLLAVSNARDGRQELTQSNELLSETGEDGSTILSRWHAESAGHKLRYVPAVLPDMLSLDPMQSGAASQEQVLTGFDLSEIDLEIAMPQQRLEFMAARSGHWQGLDHRLIKRQIRHMADLCAAHYPALRLHLFDSAKTFTAPFTVFGRIRASVYVGQAYISVTGPEEVRFFTRKFDDLVRQATVTPDAISDYLTRLSK